MTEFDRPINTRLLALLSKPAELFSVLHENYVDELNNDKDIVGKAFARIQNEGHGCAFELGLAAIPETEWIFKIILVLEKTVPHLETVNIDNLLAFEKGAYAALTNDYNGGAVRRPFYKWFGDHPNEAKILIGEHMASPCEETAPIFRAAIVGLGNRYFNEGFALGLLGAEYGPLHLAAPSISALSSYDWTKPGREEELSQFIELLVATLNKNESPLYFSSAYALQDIVSQRPEFHQKLIEVGEKGKPEGLSAVTTFLYQNIKGYKTEPWYEELLFLCTPTPANRTKSIDRLDLVLSGFAQSDQDWVKLINWFDQWIASQKQEDCPLKLAELFDSTFQKLFSHPSKISSFFTRWIMHDDGRYAEVAHWIASWMNVRDLDYLSYDLDTVNALDNDGLVLLIRRTLGWIFTEGLLINLAWSLTNAEDAPNKTYSHVYTILSSYIGYDFPHQVREFIEKKRQEIKKNAKIQGLCDQIIRDLDSYRDALDSVGTADEFKPNRSKIIAFNKARNKEMQDSMEEANEQSVILQMVTQVPVKYGKGWFGRVRGSYTPSAQFTSFEKSMALPRREVIDKVGNERDRILFRSSTRGEQ